MVKKLLTKTNIKEETGSAIPTLDRLDEVMRSVVLFIPYSFFSPAFHLYSRYACVPSCRSAKLLVFGKIGLDHGLQFMEVKQFLFQKKMLLHVKLTDPL